MDSINFDANVNLGKSTVLESNQCRREGRIETIFNSDGSKVEKQFDGNGKLQKESVFKDVNGDGKLDIYSVTDYRKGSFGIALETYTYIDKDGDGYNDEKIITKYDENNKPKSIEHIYGEDINKVKNRSHLACEVANREMENIYNGYYIRNMQE